MNRRVTSNLRRLLVDDMRRGILNVVKIRTQGVVVIVKDVEVRTVDARLELEALRDRDTA